MAADDELDELRVERTSLKQLKSTELVDLVDKCPTASDGLKKAARFWRGQPVQKVSINMSDYKLLVKQNPPEASGAGSAEQSNGSAAAGSV